MMFMVVEMDNRKEKEAFEDNFRKTEIYRRECAIRGKDILEFSKTMGAYFNIVTNDAWNMWQESKAQAVPEGFILMPKEPSADLVNHGHQVFLGHFNEGGQTGGRSLYFAYKAMIEAQEQNHD